MRLARHLARRYQNPHESIEDLVQVASIGLIKAIDRYQPDRGALSTFATPYMLGELRRHFRDRGWAVKVPRSLKDLSISVERTSQRLSTELGRSPTVAELASAMGIGEEAVLEALDVAKVHHASSLDAKAADAPAPTDGLVYLDENFLRAEHRATLAPLLRSLSTTDQTILQLRFGADLTQSEIAERLGVSQMQISRRLHRSLLELQALADADVEDAAA